MTDTVNVPREVIERIEAHCSRLEKDGSHTVIHGTPSAPTGNRYYNHDLARDLRAMLATAPKAEPNKRGPVGAVMDALWPLLGGDHTSADMWSKISDAVVAALPEAPKVEQEPDTLALNAYRHLTNYADAAAHPHRAGIRKVRDDVYAALQDRPAPTSDELLAELEAIKRVADNSKDEFHGMTQGERAISSCGVISAHVARLLANHKGPQS